MTSKKRDQRNRSMTSNSQPHLKLREVRVWKAGLAPAGTRMCGHDPPMWTHSEIRRLLWTKNGTDNPGLPHRCGCARLGGRKCRDYKASWTELNTGQRSTFKLEVPEPQVPSDSCKTSKSAGFCLESHCASQGKCYELPGQSPVLRGPLQVGTWSGVCSSTFAEKLPWLSSSCKFLAYLWEGMQLGSG